MRLLITMLLAALIGAVALAACGDEEEPAPSPTTASVAEATPAPLWPRTDCPEGWLAYLDPNGYFSFCYPVGLQAATGDGVPSGGQAVTVHLPAEPGSSAPRPNTIVFTIYWDPNASRPPDDLCRNARLSFAVATREESTAVSGERAVACRGIGDTPYHGVDPLEIEVVDRFRGGVIQIFAFQTGPDLDSTSSLIRAILSSVRIGGQP